MRASSGAHPFWVRALLVAGVALLVVALTSEELFQLGLLRRLELSTIDYRFGIRGERGSIADSSDVVIVEISEDALRSMPAPFPWPRSYYAHLVRNLHAAGARAVGIDLLFSGADPVSPVHDDSLRAALKASGIAVLAGKREEDRPDVVLASHRENYGNIFFPGDSALGLVNLRPDADGIYRLYNPFYTVDVTGGETLDLPTFGFAILNTYFRLPALTTPQPDGDAFLYAGRRIPRYDPASFLINLYGPHRTFRHVNFQDVVDDASFTTIDEQSSGEQINTFSDPEFGYQFDGTFDGKIVLVGVTVPEYKDVFPAPLARGVQKGDNLMYGVELHANVIESVIRDDFLRLQPFWSEVLMIALLAAASFLVTSWVKSLRVRAGYVLEVFGFLWIAALTAGVLFASVLLFSRHGFVLNVTSALLAIAGGYAASTVYHLVSERRQRLLIKSMFSTYVNPSVVDELVANPRKLALGGKREELTVLFSDIEGFTTISQGMQPEEIVALLNEYLSGMSAVIFRHEGTLDKYEGDAVMAFWGAPIPQADHPMRACKAALEMQDAAGRLNARWKERGRPLLRTRIGINTGTMVVGNLGGEGKFDYTVIGDSVNLASRLEGANKEYGTRIMVSELTYEAVRSEILGRQIDRMAVVGRSQPVVTYELLALRGAPETAALEQFVSVYSEGLAAYFSRDWPSSLAHFDQALQLRPDDGPARIHRERVRHYLQHPPPPEWDGVFILHSK
ncbi:MAG: adenylate cyclase [Bacteroidetes bacterium]|nr:adenylate cyclase [Bacteroidota bacterium]